MTECEDEISIEDDPNTFKSFVWQHFGYQTEIINGDRVAQKTQTTCKHCQKKKKKTCAIRCGMSAIQKHLLNHHSSLQKSAAPQKKTLKGQTFIFLHVVTFS